MAGTFHRNHPLQSPRMGNEPFLKSDFMERFNFSFSPYDILSSAERTILQSAVDMVFYDDEAIIIEANSPIQMLYVVVKGLVREVNSANEVVAVYRARDTFEARGLIEGASPNRFEVLEQALLYAIPKATVTELINANPQFGAYFYASVAQKLSNMASAKSAREVESMMTAKVRDAYRHRSIWLDGTATILHAAQTMKSNKIKSLLVRHQSQVGLLTESVMRDVVITGVSSNAPIYAWTQFNLICCDIDDYVFNALLTMTKYKIQRVVITEQGEPIGALEQIDVLAYFSNHTHLVAQRLERATSLDELVEIAAQMTHSIKILRSNGMRAQQLAQLTQILNSSLFEKAWAIIAPPELIENSCLLVMGSEGRGEQIMKTDQDNALIVREGTDVVMAENVCNAFSDALARLGYPPCDGKIMVNNPAWRKTMSDFKATIYQWCNAPEADSMMQLAIFFDAKAVAGDESILNEVHDYLNHLLSDDAARYAHFASAIMLFDSANQGFFSQLIHRDNTTHMDIKKMGIFPLVHGIRALSLEARITETNTFERIHKLTQLGIIDANLSEDLVESLSVLMDLRLDAGLSNQLLSTERNHNQVDMQSLSTLERDLLKVALQVVKRFKQMVHQHFRLGNF